MNSADTMTAYDKIMKRARDYEMGQYTWCEYMDYIENRGNFIRARVDHFLGTYAEMRLTEYNPLPGAIHKGDGKGIDLADNVNIGELKRYAGTDNGSSFKKNKEKLIEHANKANLKPVYMYWDEDKNDKQKVHWVDEESGILFLVGSAIFDYWGNPEEYDDFMTDIESVKMELSTLLRDRFDEYWTASRIPV